MFTIIQLRKDGPIYVTNMFQNNNSLICFVAVWYAVFLRKGYKLQSFEKKAKMKIYEQKTGRQSKWEMKYL
jgi:hypothetical protein